MSEYGQAEWINVGAMIQRLIEAAATGDADAMQAARNEMLGLIERISRTGAWYRDEAALTRHTFDEARTEPRVMVIPRGNGHYDTYRIEYMNAITMTPEAESEYRDDVAAKMREINSPSSEGQ